MFIDRARLKVTGGAGGNGCCSFRREKYVPLGGPEGGDGGDGGAVLLEASPRLGSLLDIRYHGHWKGKRGAHGRGKAQHGKTSGPMVVPVPCGTVVRALDSEEILADLKAPGQRFLAGAGGKGGKGNARFATAANRAPHFAELGEPGEEREFRLELKLIADVGLVGLPNAGKSTLLAHVSAARPKIADYPFTTLSPNLGVVPLSGYRTFTMADIPGIIEGAAQGKGLGHDFLRHIERTRVLLFLIDLGDEDPVQTWRTLESELAQHTDAFAKRRRLFVFNKADVTENRARFDEVAKEFKGPRLISAATGEGLDALLENLWTLVEQARTELDVEDAPEPEREYTFEAPYDLRQTDAGFSIEGKRVLRAVRMTDFENPEAVRHLQYILKHMGVFKALKRMGAKAGQSIWVGGVEMEYQPD